MGQKTENGQCRFCLETDSLGNLISPCSCKGTFQYVHNECLLKWYSHASDKALKCSVCQEEYEKAYDINLESIKPTSEIYTRCMKKPVYYLFFSHSLLIFISQLLQNPVIYYYLHFLFHFSHFFHLLTLVYNVKNRSLYRAYWISSPRILIPAFSIIMFFTMIATNVLGAFSADMFLYFSFNEHYEILSKINSTQAFYFKDRSRSRR
jgi:hypothetical protein